MKMVNNFAGLNGFVWWMGEVRNSADPLGIGRSQVRIFGWTDGIADPDLQWAHPIWSINNSKNFHALNQGDWVLGFFLDGESGQFPVMLGYIPGFIDSLNFQEQPPGA